MSKFDDVLHAIAGKLDSAADRIVGELDRLETELRSGRPSPEAVAAVKASVERLHNIVPEAEKEAGIEHEGNPDEEESETE